MGPPPLLLAALLFSMVFIHTVDTSTTHMRTQHQQPLSRCWMSRHIQVPKQSLILFQLELLVMDFSPKLRAPMFG
jgi:hypothetical protein